MISLRFNADEFVRELEREFADNVQGAVVEMKRRVAMHLRAGAEVSSPRDSGQLAESWVVAVGRPRSTRGGWAKGDDQQAEEELRELRLDQPVYVQSTDFKSGFFEHGTVKMPPRPIMAPLIEETKGFLG